MAVTAGRGEYSLERERVDADGGGAIKVDGVEPGRVLELGRSDADLDRGRGII